MPLFMMWLFAISNQNNNIIFVGAFHLQYQRVVFVRRVWYDFGWVLLLLRLHLRDGNSDTSATYKPKCVVYALYGREQIWYGYYIHYGWVTEKYRIFTHISQLMSHAVLTIWLQAIWNRVMFYLP